MFYSLLKIYARLAIKIYCSKIIINKPEVLKSKGPLLLASNHPNSFLDGMILTTLFDEPVHSLARGDVFKNKWANKLLRSLQLLPVYRTSEGVENLGHNYATFAACQKTFEESGIVLIFSEGWCENEWHLRPLKKGTARLATTAWQNNIPLKVLPVALNYSSFNKFGKEVHLLFGEEISTNNIDATASQGKRLLDFNCLLRTQLHQLVYEIDENDKVKWKQFFAVKRTGAFYFLLLPALVGFLLHAPLFYLCKLFAELYFKHSGHYDSVLASLLIITYPFYIVAAMIALSFIHPLLGVLALIALPFTAWAAVQVKVRIKL